ncbi:MAG: MoaA/NifB/PqqE/SkfB family radical SAM enzyme [Myxococcota bacterium]
MVSDETSLELPFLYLDTLWLQVTGTVCNIACLHCFITCGPKNHTHTMMSLSSVQDALDTGVAEGMRHVWFTGGEPFLHPDILQFIDLALDRGALGILTNGMLIDDALAAALGERFRTAKYNFELRVSLDGATLTENDKVRGRGVFDKTCEGIRRLAAHGLEPILAVTTLDDSEGTQERFATLLRNLGVTRPRVKWIPPFRIGREEQRGRSYETWETLTSHDLEEPEAALRLQCGTSRTVTSQGVFPCPILINEPGRLMEGDLADTLEKNRVDHQACHTCWVEGFSCST